MKNLLQEIHRRSLWQVLGVYLGTSWVVLQVVELMVENTGLPAWVMQFTMVLLMIGLPIILATAFLQKGGPALDGTAPSAQPTSEGAPAAEPSPAAADPSGAHHLLFTWRNAVLGGVLAFSLMFGIAGVYVLVRERAMSPAEAVAEEAAPAIAVLPFSVRGEDLEIWREGMVDALSINLDGATEYRTIPSQTVLARWSESVSGDVTPDMDTQLAIARKAGAKYALSGTALAMGSDVRLSAEIVDVQSGQSVARAQVEGAADGALGLVDALSIEILRQLVTDPSTESAVSLAQVTTPSLEAYRAYLEGEALLRRGELEAATAEFDRAIEADSAFALAHYRLTLIGGWGSRFGTGASTEAIDRAHEFIDRLPQRQAALVEGEWRRRNGDVAEGIRIHERAVRLYPEDPEAWYQLGETYLHWGSSSGYTPDQAEDAFRRAVALDPQFAPYHWHLIDLAVILGRDSATLADRIAAHERIASEVGDHTGDGKTLLALTHGDSASHAQAVEEVSRMERTDLITLTTALRHPRVAGELVLVLDRLYEVNPRNWYRPWAATTLAAGRLDDGREYLPSDWDVADLLDFATFSRMLEIPVDDRWLDSLRAELDPDTPEEETFDYFYEASLRGDTATVRRLQEESQLEADSMLAAAVSVRDSSMARRRQANVFGNYGVEAFLQGRFDDAVESFEQTLPYVGNLQRYLLARSYMRLGRWEEAERMFRTLFYFDYSLVWYHLGRVYEELGEPAKARQAYEDFTIAWSDADPELQPFVEEARAEMARLGDFPGSE